MKYSHNLLESYWNQWTKEYLNELREHHTTGKNVNSTIKLGEIVFIHNHNAKRNVWKLGKVVRLFTHSKFMILEIKILTEILKLSHTILILRTMVL